MEAPRGVHDAQLHYSPASRSRAVASVSPRAHRRGRRASRRHTRGPRSPRTHHRPAWLTSQAHKCVCETLHRRRGAASKARRPRKKRFSLSWRRRLRERCARTIRRRRSRRSTARSCVTLVSRLGGRTPRQACRRRSSRRSAIDVSPASTHHSSTHIHSNTRGYVNTNICMPTRRTHTVHILHLTCVAWTPGVSTFGRAGRETVIQRPSPSELHAASIPPTIAALSRRRTQYSACARINLRRSRTREDSRRVNRGECVAIFVPNA